MSSLATMLANLKSALARRDRVAVNKACRALIDARAPIGGQWRAVAMVLLENGEMRLARRAADLLVQAAGNSALARFVQAEIYARSGQAVEADRILAQLPSDVPDPLGNAYTRGTTALNIGAFDTAREQLRRAVGLAPRSGQSWLALAMAGRVWAEDGQRMLDVREQMVDAPPAERGPFFYALGKFLHEAGDTDAAFASFAHGARAEVEARGPSGDDIRIAKAVEQDWTAERLQLLAPPKRTASRPIFVTGLPRSGTTLVEQILTAHSGVDGGEELSLFRHVLADLGGVSANAAAAAIAAGRDDRLVALYEHLLSERFAGTGRVVDKTLLASRYMGPLIALFPNAPIVWLRRDPLDNAWSIFRTYFRSELGWTFHLKRIAEQMRIDDLLFAHWSKLRPQQILRVDYADLVGNPDKIIPQIVDHCGLSLEPQQLRPEDSDRTVVTASVAQVRRPIHRDSVGAADPYRRHLQPFIDAYTALGGSVD